MDMAARGEDPTPVYKFYEKLQRNPSWRSVQQLWQFLQHDNIPLTEDGCFLAYKGVNANFTDKHTGKVDNHPGKVNEMQRNMISDDPNQACHYGYHVGALSYARSFAGGGGKLVICKVDPEHVVCVPYDSSQEKMRVCKYEVLGLYGAPLPSVTFKEDIAPPEEQEDEDDADTGDNEDNDNGDTDELAEHEESLEEIDSEEAEDSYNSGDDDESSDGDGSGTEEEEEVAPAKKKVSKPKRDKKQAKPSFAKYSRMNTKALMDVSLDDLRKYATYGLKIVGASKIPGGKAALVSKILKNR